MLLRFHYRANVHPIFREVDVLQLFYLDWDHENPDHNMEEKNEKADYCDKNVRTQVHTEMKDENIAVTNWWRKNE